MPRRLCFLVAGLVVLTGCSRSVSKAYTTQTSTTLSPAVTAPAPVAPPTPTERITFTGAAFDLHAAGAVSPAVIDATWAGVLDTLDRYLEAAVLIPLGTGGPAGDLTALFTGPAIGRVIAGGPDRFAFIDENLPPVSDLRKEAASAGFTALAGPDGVLSVVTAGLDLRVVGQVNGAPVRVVRTGELVLVPENGTWRIDGYDIRVVRTLAEHTTTTTVRT